MSLPSALMLFPASNIIKSPGTNSSASISCSRPSRITRVRFGIIFCRLSMAFSALNSCQKVKMPLMMTTPITA